MIGRAMATTRVGAGWRELGNGSSSQAAALEVRIAEALDCAPSVLGVALASLAHPSPPDDLEAAEASLEHLAELALERLRDSRGAKRAQLVELCEFAIECQSLRQQARDRRLGRRFEALARVQDGLSRLRGVGSVPQMLEKATAEVCRSCGFDRAVLFRVEGSELVAESTHFERDPEWAAEILELARSHRPQLNHMLLETEMLRRREPALVEDAQNDPRTFKPIVLPIRTTSYVAAPIMPEGRVIGFLHADCYFSARPLDTLDRDTLWTFAEGFGYAVERTILLERLRSQREEIGRMVRATEATINEVCEAEVDLVGVERQSAEVARSTAAILSGDPSGLKSLLTRRELEVLRLMAEGLKNAEIADRLVISEGTVKSHVKHILRKLHAANRAEAISRSMRLVQEDVGLR